MPGIPITTPSFWLQQENDDFESGGHSSAQSHQRERDPVSQAPSNPSTATGAYERKLDTELFLYIFRSDTAEDIPLAAERLTCLREAAEVLKQVSTR